MAAPIFRSGSPSARCSPTRSVPARCSAASGPTAAAHCPSEARTDQSAPSGVLPFRLWGLTPLHGHVDPRTAGEGEMSQDHGPQELLRRVPSAGRRVVRVNPGGDGARHRRGSRDRARHAYLPLAEGTPSTWPRSSTRPTGASPRAAGRRSGWPKQGPTRRPALCRAADDLCGLGDDPGVGPHRQTRGSGPAETGRCCPRPLSTTPT